MKQILHFFGVFFLLLSTATFFVYGAPPPRIFGNKNILMRATESPQNIIPEEELELESLKGHGVNGNFGQSQPLPESSVSTTTSSPVGSENVKRPENEEKPALSDNANSLKFSHHSSGGLADVLFSKKSHLSGNLNHQTISNVNDNVNNNNNKQEIGISSSSSSSYKDPSSLVGTSLISSDHPNFQLDYTPQDIAAYIFWTGDERGVAMAIGDFLQDGLVDREDAVRFLEDVKRELNSIRSRYSASVSQGQQVYPHNSNGGINFGQTVYPSGFQTPKLGDIRSSKRESYSSPEMTNPLANLILSAEGNGLTRGLPQQHQSQLSNANLPSIEDLDYDEIAERLRTADSKLREYSLEEVIYALGKDLFAQSLKNSPGQSIQKFSTFVENQVASGRIPKDLEKDVLEALVGAFVDAVDEHGEQPGQQQQSQQSQVSKTYDGRINSNPHLNNIQTNPNPTPTILNKKASSS